MLPEVKGLQEGAHSLRDEKRQCESQDQRSGQLPQQQEIYFWDPPLSATWRLTMPFLPDQGAEQAGGPHNVTYPCETQNPAYRC